MSPRSEEFMDQARDRATIAREVLASGHLEGAVSAAYYAMLYAARAVLSEDDKYARTHRGAWHRIAAVKAYSARDRAKVMPSDTLFDGKGAADGRHYVTQVHSALRAPADP